MNDQDTGSCQLHDRRELNLIFLHSTLDDYGLSPAEFRVYSHIARRVGSGGKAAWPSVPSIATKCRIKEDTVWYVLKALENNKLIQIERTLGKPNFYYLTSYSEWVRPFKPLPKRKWKKKPNQEKIAYPPAFGGRPLIAGDHPPAFGGHEVYPGEVNPNTVLGFSGGEKSACESGKKIPTHKIKPPPNPDHQPFIDWWMAEYERKFGHTYDFLHSRDGANVKHLLSLMTRGELQMLVKNCWLGAGGFNCGQMRSLQWLRSHINEIRSEQSTPIVQTQVPFYRRGGPM